MEKKIIGIVMLTMAIFLLSSCGNNFKEQQIADYVAQTAGKDIEKVTKDDIAAIDSIYMNCAESVKDISKFPNISSLTVTDSEIEKWDAVYKTKLKSLELWNNKGTVDIEKLDKSNLESIILMGDVKNLESLKNAQKLTSVVVWNCAGADFSFLNELPNLTYLEIVNSEISDISFVKNMNNLTSLVLSENLISDISALKNKMGITLLDLRHNKLTDISALDNIIDLQELDISQNNITDISPLKELTGLISLNISSNDIEDISVLSGLRFLESVDMAANNIKSISALGNLSSLQEVLVSHNLIGDVPDNLLKSAYYLDLSANNIKINNAKFFVLLESNAGDGVSVNLFDNPLSDGDIKMLEKIESVSFLSNNLPVSAEGYCTYNNVINRIVRETAGKSNIEKISYVYKYLTSACEKIGTETLADSLGGYNVIVNKKGTSLDCAEAFASVLRRMGINSDIYNGDMFDRTETDMKHYWNLAEIDGKKCYFDVYCDIGNSVPKYFGVNDREMSENGHIMLDYYYGSVTDNIDYAE